MLILGIDTTTKMASAAVVSIDEVKTQVLCETQSYGSISHSENLMPMIDYTLKTAGVLLSEIDLFAVSHGPGSFTGIRISIATVKGLAFLIDDIDETHKNFNNCVGISSLYSLAYNFRGLYSDYSDKLIILPVIDARRKQVYNAIFELTGIYYIEPERITTIRELEDELNLRFKGYKVIFAGDGADMCHNEINFDGKINVPEILKKPSASSLCRIAYEKYKEGETVHPRVLAPSYLIKTQAEREYNTKNNVE